MKTIFIFIFLFYSFFLSGQSSPPLIILEEGERMIMLNRPEDALAYAQTILARPKLDLLSRNQALLVKGRAYFKMNEADASVVPLQKSLSIARRLKNKPLILNTLVALGSSMLMKETPRMDSVLIFMEEAKPLAEALKDTSCLARIHNGFAQVSMDEEDYDKALEHCYLCDLIVKNSRYEFDAAACQHNAGGALLDRYFKDGNQDDLKAAIVYFQKAIVAFKHLGNKRAEARARINISTAAAFLDDYKQAETETKLAIELGEALKDSTILLDGYYNLANHYEGENRLADAVMALGQMEVLLSKIGTDKEIAFVKDQFSNHEIRVTDALIKNRVDLLNKQIEIAKSVQEKQVLWFVSILLVLIIISILIYVYQKQKLSAQKEKLIQEQLGNLLKSQELEFMRAKFEGEEESRHRIARQIHDGVGGLLVSAKWNLESALEEISKSETKVAARLNENLRLQEHSYKELRRVVYALEREDIPWWEDLQQFYQHIEVQNTTKIRFYTYNLDRKVGGAVGEEARLIVQELVANALKHASAPQINVQINQIEDVLGIIIEDNGIGFDLQKVKKGIGLRSIEERCRKLDGTISFETGKGVGTTVFIDIPINKCDFLTDNPLLYARTN